MMSNFDDKKNENESVSLEDLAAVLSTYGNVSRLQIVQQLERAPSDFSNLKEITKLSKTALAHHLEKLVKYGIIAKTSRGKYKLTEDGSGLYSAISDSYTLSQRKIDFESKQRADHIQDFYSGSKNKKDDIVVTFERLMPMRVVSFQAISNSPENDAWKQLREWAEPRGLFADPIAHSIYGFNNPNPQKGKKEYGYEFWIQVDPNFHEEDVKILDIPEDYYIVTRCVVNDPEKDIPEAWTKLLDLIKAKGYEFGDHCGLEKVISSAHTGNWILDIYIPIKEESVTNPKS